MKLDWSAIFPTKISSKGLRRAGVLLGVVGPYGLLLAQQAATPPKVSYGRDVAPILKAHCESCHSGANADAALDLSGSKGLLKGGDSGAAIVPGKPDGSLLLQRIRGLGGLPKMPKGLPPLSAADISTIRNWIAAGAKIDDTVVRHWAYVAPVQAPVPKLNSTWVRNPIDAFVLAKLRSEGLHPSPEATKETLIRRLSLDLVGLPPTLKEIDAFVADKRPDAYERLVDRLMASPHYGERQARGWLDLARYADTDGFEKDLNRTAWKYRDWVIDAFNRNLSYKDFVIQQIAGDMLPNASLDEKIATGFNRNTMFNREGGVDQEEAHFNVILDRVDTTATVFLGSTLQCARCHDHKYDPFTQRDYYKMAAFFSNTNVNPQGPANIGEEKWFEPQISAPSPAQSAVLARLTNEVTALDEQYHAWDKDKQSDFDAWKAAVAAPIQFQPIAPSSASSDAGAKFTEQPDQSLLVSGKLLQRDTYHLSFPPSSVPVTGLRLEALADPTLHGNGPGRSDNGNFVLTGMKLLVGDKEAKIASVQVDFSQDNFDPSRVIALDKASGWAVGPQLGKNHELLAVLADPIPAGQPFTLQLEQQSTSDYHLLGRFRVSTYLGSDSAMIAVPTSVRALVAKTNRTPAEDQTLKESFLGTTPSVKLTRDKLASVRKAQTDLNAQIPTALVLEEMPTKEAPFAYVRHRGEFLNKTERVIAGTPGILPPLPAGRPDRLALGKWLVSPNNPLTARVEVNRIWEKYFGRGIVETSEDFGTRGAPPTHPKLLDWLAVQFMHSGWDLKALNRMIVMSSTYRQTSDATPAIMAKDPQNLFYARGPRFRMEAEMIHDEALAASGLLSLKMGGPSVMPYQPNGVWDSPYSAEQWHISPGEDRYRRGIYTFIKRTAPYPAFLTLDSTSRESCTVRRIRTNTPLQALELLNDKLMVEAARSLGQEMEHAATSDSQRLAIGFRICTARTPNPKESARLKSLLTRLESRYRSNPKAAAELGKSSEDAAYTMVGNVLLNLDETITKG